jgi:hypothetical protein
VEQPALQKKGHNNILAILSNKSLLRIPGPARFPEADICRGYLLLPSYGKIHLAAALLSKVLRMVHLYGLSIIKCQKVIMSYSYKKAYKVCT